MSRQVAECGTKSGYVRHLRVGEVPCEPCQTASAQARRNAPSYVKRVAKPRGPLQPCGTNAAYMRHLRHREIPCEACYKAHSVYSGRRKLARAAKAVAS
jgi:hypothetical protein